MQFSDQSLQNSVLRILAEYNLVLPKTFVIAFSGGLDSSVLLHSFKQWRAANSAVHLKAIHINHQLQTASDSWQTQCAKICQELQIELQSIKVVIDKSARKGLESAAREARYAAFKAVLGNEEILVTAHHLDDQVETLLLRLFRGTGLAGAAAMQAIKPFHFGYLMRPLLDVPRDSLLSYAHDNQLNWIDDPSNIDNSFDRNYLRNHVLPIIEKRWPAYAASLSRFSRHTAEANGLLQSSIQRDYEKCLHNEKLDCVILKNFALEQQKAILRHWFKQLGVEAPTEKQLGEMLKLVYAKQDANPLVVWSDRQLRRFKNRLYVMPALKAFDNQQVLFWDSTMPINIPGVGELSAHRLTGASLPLKLEVRFRCGGESCYVPGRQGLHTLKKLFQEQDIPPWLRNRTPIVMADQQIVAVVGLFSVDDKIRFQLKRVN